jgi:hypothetical protein
MFSAAERTMAASISATLTAIGAARDAMTEQVFHLTYGSPFLQALVGIDSSGAEHERRPEREALREQAKAKKREELEASFEIGGVIEAALRSLAYIRMGEGSVDERGYAMVKQLHEAQPTSRLRTLEELKAIVRDQYLLLRLDEERAVAAIPKLLPRDRDECDRTLRAIQRIASSRGNPSDEGKKRMAKIEKLFGTKAAPASRKEGTDVRA